jgi:AcrR family transcriptional regulator
MLQAAREIFETRGYQAASVATITKAAETATAPSTSTSRTATTPSRR